MGREDPEEDFETKRKSVRSDRDPPPVSRGQDLGAGKRWSQVRNPLKCATISSPMVTHDC